MGQIKKLLETAFFSLMFCCAFFILIKKGEGLLRLQQEIAFCLNNEIAYEQRNKAEEIIVTKEEILAFLMAGFAGYDIKVEGRMLHRNIYDYYDRNEYDIEECTYRKTYIYDSVGRIEAIIFTRIADAE